MYSLTLVMCILAITANVIELNLICRYKSLCTSNNPMIMSLAVSDLLFGPSATYTSIMNILTARAELYFDV